MRAEQDIRAPLRQPRLLLRLTVPVVFLLALMLNSLAMSAPVQMQAAMAPGMAMSAAMEHAQGTPHALHQGAKAAHCQEMAQCTGVPVPAGGVALASPHGETPRRIADERFAGLLPGPPFHPPIL